MLTARLSRSRARFVITLVFVALALWATRHIIKLIHIGSLGEYLYTNWIYLFSFILIALTLILANREKPRGASIAAELYNDHITVVVPAYNEDPAALKACLRSLIEQTRPVQSIYLVDDGSTTSDYANVKDWFIPFATDHGVKSDWIRQENGGKRHAQAAAFNRDSSATIFVTVDSDSILDGRAIEEIMKPFTDQQIQSVAGVVLAKNNQTNLLARITDLLFVTGQLVDRSMMSSLGSVLVNSGGLAAYRAEVVRDNLDSYLHETFFGRTIEFSDDSMLTLYALQRGKTVQQPSAFVFTMMPDRVNHHLRQQNRWMKGSFIRSWWRLKYLPLSSFGFFRQAIGWLQFVMTTTFLVLMLFTSQSLDPTLLIYILMAPVILGYAQALRYFSVRRSDESIWSQILTYTLTPLAIIWSLFVLRPIRLYASATCLMNPKWGTREEVEITLDKAPTRSIIFSFPSFAVYLQTEYERLICILRDSGMDNQQAELVWIEHYTTLSEKQRVKLWNGYNSYQSRLDKYASIDRMIQIQNPFRRTNLDIA